MVTTTGNTRRRHLAPLVRFAVSASFIAVSFVLPGNPVRADGITDLQAQAEAIANELDNLEIQMQGLDEDYASAIESQASLSEEIKAAEQQVGETEARLSAMRGTLYGAAVAQFIGGGRNSMLTQLLATNGGVQDALQRQQFTAVAMNTGAMTTDELDTLVIDLTKQKKKLEDKRSAAERAAAAVLSRQSAAEKLAAAYQVRQASLQGELAVAVKAERERRAAAAADEAKRIADGYSSRYSQLQSKYRNIPKVSARSQAAVNAALTQLGVRYRYGAMSPGQAFDCSGLTTWAWGRAGVGLQRSSRTQYSSLPHVPKELAQPGDLIFTGSPIHHVGMYLGGGRYVHAPQTGDVVKISAVTWSKVIGVARPG